MKARSIFLLLTILSIMLLSSLTATAAVRTVLVEGFTNWSCAPCAEWNPTERALLEAFTRDTVLSIKYHTNWPGLGDGFYLSNIEENTARWNYYGVSWVPWVMCDGTVDVRNVNFSTLRNAIRSRRALAAPCTIEMEAVGDGPYGVHVTGTVTATDSAITGVNDRLFLALITDQICYNNAPGGNGETYFPSVFRDMWPNTNGQVISIPLHGTYQFDATLVKDSLWKPDSLSVIAFIQDRSSKWMHQSAWTHVVSLWGMTVNTSDPIQNVVDVNSGETTYTIFLRNDGRNNDTYTVSLDSPAPEGWIRSVSAEGVPANPNIISVPLNSGQSTNVLVAYNPNGHKGKTEINVSIQSQGDQYTRDSKTYYLMAGPDILVVDDDGGLTNVENFYLNALQATQGERLIGCWDQSRGALDEITIPNIPLIIWETGSNSYGNTLNMSEQSFIDNYLNNGGKLFLSGQGISFDLRNSEFLAYTLHAAFIRPYNAGHNLVGIAGNPVSEGLNFTINGGDGANNQGRQEKIRPYDAAASVLWHWENVGGDTSAALQIQTAQYRAVYMAFGFEAINSTDGRAEVMRRIVDWLLYGVVAVEPQETPGPQSFSVSQAYPNPFNSIVNIEYVVPNEQQVKVTVFDMLGREVVTLLDEKCQPGNYKVSWKADQAATGLYFLKMSSGESISTRKVLLLK